MIYSWMVIEIETGYIDGFYADYPGDQERIEKFMLEVCKSWGNSRPQYNHVVCKVFSDMKPMNYPEGMRLQRHLEECID